MMLSNDFNTEFGDKNDMPADIQERSPGVYVRDDEHELPRELDMLWSGSRAYPREDRNPLFAFLAGLLVGALVTSAVFLLIVMKPNVKADPNEITKPVATNDDAQQAKSAKASQLLGNNTTYTVVPGDNLGKISLKVYGSTEPKFLQKIQRANNMNNPNHLQLKQTLVIPPKDY